MDIQISEATVAGVCPECDAPYSRAAADGFACPCGWTESDEPESKRGASADEDASGADPEETKPRRASKKSAASKSAEDELARTLTEDGQYAAAEAVEAKTGVASETGTDTALVPVQRGASDGNGGD